MTGLHYFYERSRPLITLPTTYLIPNYNNIYIFYYYNSGSRYNLCFGVVGV